MIKGITKKNHWPADYAYVPLVMAAPKLAGFEDEKQAAGLCRVLSITSLGYSLLTDAKWGVVKVIPYRTHAALDLTLGIVALAAPSVINVSSRARKTFLLMGLTGVVVGVLSLVGAGRGK